MPTRFMTTAEVAEILRTSSETVRYWRHIGKGPGSFKVGRKVLYRADDVEAWISRCQREQSTGTTAA